MSTRSSSLRSAARSPRDPEVHGVARHELRLAATARAPTSCSAGWMFARKTYSEPVQAARQLRLEVLEDVELRVERRARREVRRVHARPAERAARDALEAREVDLVLLEQLACARRENPCPTTAVRRTGARNDAATEKYEAAPPRTSRAFRRASRRCRGRRNRRRATTTWRFQLSLLTDTSRKVSEPLPRGRGDGLGRGHDGARRGLPASARAGSLTASGARGE